MQHVLPLSHNQQDHSRESFIVTESNKAAYQFVTGRPGQSLFIHGPAACGKTHLANIWREQLGSMAFPIHLSAEKLPDVSSIRSAAIVEWTHMPGAKVNEEYVFHLLNRMKDHRLPILITASANIADLNIKLPDVRSRLLAIPLVGIDQPDDMLVEALLLKAASERQIKLMPDVVHYIVQRLERTYLAIQEIVEKLDKVSLAERRNITVPFVRILLES